MNLWDIGVIGYLSEVSDLVFDSLSHNRIVDGLQVDAALVGQVVKHVCCSNGLRTWKNRNFFFFFYRKKKMESSDLENLTNNFMKTDWNINNS